MKSLQIILCFLYGVSYGRSVPQNERNYAKYSSHSNISQDYSVSRIQDLTKENSGSFDTSYSKPKISQTLTYESDNGADSYGAPLDNAYTAGGDKHDVFNNGVVPLQPANKFSTYDESSKDIQDQREQFEKSIYPTRESDESYADQLNNFPSQSYAKPGRGSTDVNYQQQNEQNQLYSDEKSSRSHFREKPSQSYTPKIQDQSYFQGRQSQSYSQPSTKSRNSVPQERIEQRYAAKPAQPYQQSRQQSRDEKQTSNSNYQIDASQRKYSNQKSIQQYDRKPDLKSYEDIVSSEEYLKKSAKDYNQNVFAQKYPQIASSDPRVSQSYSESGARKSYDDSRTFSGYENSAISSEYSNLADAAYENGAISSEYSNQAVEALRETSKANQRQKQISSSYASSQPSQSNRQPLSYAQSPKISFSRSDVSNQNEFSSYSKPRFTDDKNARSNYYRGGLNSAAQDKSSVQNAQLYGKPRAGYQQLSPALSYESSSDYNTKTSSKSPSFSAYSVSKSPASKKTYQDAASYGTNGIERQDRVHEKGRPYSFEYEVNDEFSSNNQGRREESDGDTVNGMYHVLLPDGRMQIVTYTADWKNGFQADVRYEGEAKYDFSDDAQRDSRYPASSSNGYGYNGTPQSRDESSYRQQSRDDYRTPKAYQYPSQKANNAVVNSLGKAAY